MSRGNHKQKSLNPPISQSTCRWEPAQPLKKLHVYHSADATALLKAINFQLHHSAKFLAHLSHGILGGDMFEDLVPSFMSRMKGVREVLLPVPEETLKEGLYYAASNYIPLDSETELCRNHSNFMFESFLNFDLWALKMVDASSKLPSGILDGCTKDIGNYDQCLSVEAPGKLFSGQLCVVEVTGFLPDLGTKLQERPFGFFGGDFLFSVCVPSSCTAQDVKTHLDLTLNSINASATISDSSCSSNIPVPLETKEWIAILVIVAIVMLVALSTAYETSSMERDKNTLLCAFSLKTNGRQMISTRTTPAALTCLNGLRVLAMFWVIVGHRMFAMLTFPALRSKTILEC
ncbi:hypothetical protein J6590_041539 [Homalodisca vitripennis]|nr:hypothetical protein J6590_041539 [Homalodisca vitripennis]